MYILLDFNKFQEDTSIFTHKTHMLKIINKTVKNVVWHYVGRVISHHTIQLTQLKEAKNLY